MAPGAWQGRTGGLVAGRNEKNMGRAPADRKPKRSVRRGLPVTQRLSADAEGIARAASLLRGGGTVAFPTETVYGLGANALYDPAVAQIFEAKNRPSFNPLIVHVPNAEAAWALTHANDTARQLAAAFWPGPLTLVLPLRLDAGISPLVTAGLTTLAVRVPAHDLARRLLTEAGVPVAAPSANPSGRVSPTTAEHVLDGLRGRIAAVLDGGRCAVGLESTIVGLHGAPTLLRPGGLAAETIEGVLGAPLAPPPSAARPNAPGQLASHYAPLGRVRLEASEAHPGETLIGFGPVAGDVTLSASGDLAEAAARLFHVLRDMDQQAVQRIAVAPIPDIGLGRAINDRLRRAAAPRV